MNDRQLHWKMYSSKLVGRSMAITVNIASLLLDAAMPIISGGDEMELLLGAVNCS
ncbi:hypothetical protein BDQ12DRAFT_687358 [Crucibulum laeve]|uniref:Uncharacterized protein n=1 Tax=Crucibulum laeve TaxID=68775 RepID=A0A5C3M4V2_9AGAR|nr:hypothetical protein BDQ12DRAFT_687358 [Crucibulum laeve]